MPTYLIHLTTHYEGMQQATTRVDADSVEEAKKLALNFDTELEYGKTIHEETTEILLDEDYEIQVLDS